MLWSHIKVKVKNPCFQFYIIYTVHLFTLKSLNDTDKLRPCQCQGQGQQADGLTSTELFSFRCKTIGYFFDNNTHLKSYFSRHPERHLTCDGV